MMKAIRSPLTTKCCHYLGLHVLALPTLRFRFRHRPLLHHLHLPFDNFAV